MHAPRPLRPALAAGIIAAAACAIAPAACGPPAEFPRVADDARGEPIADRVGIAHQLVWGTAADQRSAREAQIAKLLALGIRHVRMDFSWHALEKSKGSWSFAALDAVVDDAHAASIELLAMAGYGNPLYSSKARAAAPGLDLPLDAAPKAYFAPDDPSDYARFVSKLVERYKDRVDSYELWNEENIGYRFWRPAADPRGYAKLAELGARAGKKQCPGCLFILGGLSMSQPVPTLNLYPVGPKYLDAACTARPQLHRQVEAVSFHPYPYPKDPPEKETAPFADRVQGSLRTQTRQIRSAIEPHGEMRLWITENGWPTNPKIPQTDAEISRVFGIDPLVVKLGRSALTHEEFSTLLETVRGVSEEKQAQYLVRAALLGISLGIERQYLYALQDYDIDPEVNQEGAFGLYRVDGRAKKSAAAVRTLLRRFGAYRYAADLGEALGLGPDERALAFRKPGHLLLALWRWRDGSRQLQLSDLPGEARAFDLYGEPLGRGGTGGRLAVPLGPAVTYVEIALD